MTALHLHLDDAPGTLAILNTLLGHKTDTAAIGYAPDEWGAEVDWDMLDNSYLSTTERASLRIARGCSILESLGVPEEAKKPMRDLMERITRERP